jgi:histidinol-phosphatase (PHP family)
MSQKINTLFDSHIHTPLCKHAKGSPLEYAQAALERGLAGIVITDHMPMPAWFDAPWRMALSELDRYLEWVLEAKAAMQGRLEVRIGLEADFHPGTERFVEKVLGRYPWDYVMGSVHYLGAWGFDNPDFKEEYEWRDLEGIYRDYYALVVQAAQTGLFDAIGHLDLPKKFGHAQPAPSLAIPALEAIASADMALDYNTAGLRKPIAEIYPAVGLCRVAAQLGIPFVLGSDAHAPAEVGYAFEEAVQTLEGVGGQMVTFKGRARG